MKASKFNLFVEKDKKDVLVYNTLKGTVTMVDSTLADILKKEGVYELESNNKLGKILDGLAQQGIVLDNLIDEIEEYRQMHQRWKSGKESVEFNALLTYDCNFECPYCYQGRGEKGEKIHNFEYMTNELLNALIRFIKRTAIERESKKLELVLYGGEPFLPKARDMGRELTDKIAEWAQNQSIEFKLHVLSNGSLINQEIVNWLSGYDARLQIPVDGDQQMHNKYRFYKKDKMGSFEDVAKVLGMTKGTNIETHIRISLTDETSLTMERLLDELKKRELTHVFPDFCYITAFTEACADFKEHTLPDLKLFKIMPELWRKAYEKGFPLDIRPQVQPLPCSSVADGSYIVDPFANVYKCWELVGLPEHVVGKIHPDGSLEKTNVYNDVLERNPLKIKPCKDHNYLPACGGGCVCKAYWQSKTYDAPGCGTEKYLLNDKIKVYVETLDLSNTPVLKAGDLRLQLIEGRQKPKMSHCYVLV